MLVAVSLLQGSRPPLTHQRRLKPAPICNTATGANPQHGYRDLTAALQANDSTDA